MGTFAVHEGGVVVNVIVAETISDASALTGMSVVEVVEGAPWIGWTLEAEGWREPAPFPSWVWDGQAAVWTAPVPQPAEGFHYWDEDAQSWIEFTPEPMTEPAPEA